MATRTLHRLFHGLVLTISAVSIASAQTAESAAQRSMVTRHELDSTLAVIDREVNSTGYSQAVRDARKAVADAIRNRLENGDLQVGDVIKVSVPGYPAYSHEYIVSANRTIGLPGGVEISVAKKLRSELPGYLKTVISEYVVEPRVTATASIRIQISGAVGKPGFFVAPASDLLSAVLMEAAGGPAGSADLDKSEIKHGDVVVLGKGEFRAALREGKTLDALNVQAGDEIIVAQKPAGSNLYKIFGAVTAVTSLVYLLKNVF